MGVEICALGAGEARVPQSLLEAQVPQSLLGKRATRAKLIKDEMRSANLGRELSFDRSGL